MATSTELEINGKRYSVNYPPDTPLLYVLRDELGLTGTKYGCGEGMCGACTVLIADGALHPVQQAFLDAGAFQCAYCTSGMIMSSVSLLQANPHPSTEQIVQSLQGNICRCGTHPRIIEAVQRAAGTMQERSK